MLFRADRIEAREDRLDYVEENGKPDPGRPIIRG